MGGQQQADNADSSGKTEAGGSSKGNNLDGALKLKPELLIPALYAHNDPTLHSIT